MKTIVELAIEKRKKELEEWKVNRISRLLEKKEHGENSIKEIEEKIKQVEKLKMIPDEGSSYNISGITYGNNITIG